MTNELRALLSTAALKRLGGTDLEYDLNKLEQLARVVPEEQEQVVRSHVGFGIPWNDAFEGKTLRSPVASANEPLNGPPPSGLHARAIERRKIAELRANRFNAALFPDSLSDASIAQIADDLARNGQRVAVEIMPDGEIMDGERRWRGAQRLGWNEIEVTVGPALSDEEVLDRVIDCCTSARQMTVREQANVYAAVCEQLRREAGRQQGRPEKTFQNRNVYLTARGVRDAAAARAGFSSPALALRAEAIFKRGSEDLQSRVRDGSLSISAAYEELPKRAKAGSQTEEEVSDSTGSGEPVADTATAPHTLVDPVADAAMPAAADTPAPRAETTAIPNGGAPADCQDEPEQEASRPEVDDHSEDDSIDPAAVEKLSVGQHVTVICGHLTRLAERDYEEAVSWLAQTIEEMQASLGEPPPSDDDEVFEDDDA